ncbi:cyclic nucleotide-binding domain-containing protein, putative [Eimeria praecox]|uniref:Cyclic nucleotide-binding domain-containing protein, putative n=1 Tax=Eimeria praecox TaxID=51316 RepID=U6H2P7_9EIME|nr:cyclic nucleotide-binding domain-containing protein, putative [Eimeria praecox]
MGGQSGEKDEAGRTVSGAERSNSRNFMGWIRQSSVKRFRSREVSRTPRDWRPDKDDVVCTPQATTENGVDASAPGKGDHSLAAMFMSVPSRTKLRDEPHEVARDGVAVRRAYTSQSLGAQHSESIVHTNSMPHASIMLHASAVNIDDPRLENGGRSARSDPGDVSDADMPSGKALHSNGEKTEDKGTQKAKRAGSSSGLGRIGSFFTRSFSKHRSRSNRHLKDEREPPAADVESPETPPIPALSDAVSAPPALSLAALDALPDFSAADWLAKFEQEGNAAASSVMTVCGGALEAVAAHLGELEKSVRLLQQTEQQQPQQQQHEEVEEENATEAAQEVAERLAATRKKMDGADQQIFSQMRYHGEQIVLGELLRMIATVKNIMHGIKYAASSDTAAQHDLQGEEEQLQAWQEPCGALRENKNCLEALYARVRSTRNQVLSNYHEECLRLNQSVQLLMDRIQNTVGEVFAELQEPPSLETLYGRQQITNQHPKCKHPGAELRSKGSSSWVASHQLAFSRLPTFISRLQLYAFNSPSFSKNGYEDKGCANDIKNSSGHPAVQATQLFTPLSLQQCLPRKSCIKTVPPGLAIMASQAEIERYESQLWAGGPSDLPAEGGFGSFRVFEQWLVDAMKWQWRDAFMYSKLHERHESMQEMIKEKQRDIQEAVRLRLKQLWWGRTVEMQAFHATQAAAALMRDLGGVEELHGVTATEGTKGKEEAGRLEGAASETLLLRSGREAETALMRAEDMRASVMRVVGNPAYGHFKRSLEEFKARPSDAAAQINFLKEQVDRAASLTRRFEDAAEGKDGYETLERECSQLEAALALLEEEAKSLEKKLSFRQSQLAAKRQSLTHSLERLSAAFDADNKKLAAIEAQWDSAEKIGQLIHDFLPAAEEITACKHKLAEERIQLEAEKEEARAERQRLEAIRQEVENAKKAKADAGTSPVPGPHVSTTVDPNKPQGLTSSSPRTAAQGEEPRLSTTPSKSFVSRIFGGSSRPSTPRKSKAAAHDEASATTETLQQSATPRRGSADTQTQPHVPKEELLPLKHGNSAPVHLDKPLDALKDSNKSIEATISQQTNAEQSTHDLPGPPVHTLSSPSLLTLEHEDQRTPSSSSLAIVAASAKEEEPHTTESRNAEGVELHEASRQGTGVSKRKKSKDNTTWIGSSRRSGRKKKSMYSKLRSAFSLSHSSKKSREEAEAAQQLIENVNRADEHEATQRQGSSPEAANEHHWLHVGSQSSVLATIPNIFDSEGEDVNDEEGSASPGNASASFSLMVGASSRSEGSNQPAEDAGLQQEAADASAGRSSGASPLSFTGKDNREVSPTLSLAESFRRASPEKAERTKMYAIQATTSPSQPLHQTGVANKFPSDSSAQENSPQFGSAHSSADFWNKDESEEEMKSAESSDANRSKVAEYQGEAAENQPEAGPLVPFPSLSAGPPADFRSGVEGQIVSAKRSFHEESEPAEISSQRRRSDTAVSSSVYSARANRKYGKGHDRTATAFDRLTAGFRSPSASGLVDEDDRIELFLSNNQPDLTAAVMSSSIFALLEPEERQHCVHLMLNSFVQIPKGCMLVQRGEKVDTLYFLVSGELGMTEPHVIEPPVNSAALSPPAPGYHARRRSSYDAEVPQEKFPIQIGPGAFVVPRAFVREEQTNHSIMALRPCTLQKLSFHSFQQVISGCARAVRFVERQGNPDVVDEYGPGDNINALALLHDTPSDVSIIAAAPDGCVVAVLARSELQDSLGDAETILNRRFGNSSEMQGGRTSGLTQLKKQFSSLWNRRGSD